ncbi:MAG: hypothetical protein B6245_12860 [Desulfobacteraceae bacterium 4572_88]|nr:MAG: hypothetical protein B6245_12860 [Desulfobacteraceae bacterium 4572_88]
MKNVGRMTKNAKKSCKNKTRETFVLTRQAPAYISEKRLALIIGNSNYAHGGSLKNPVNDARAVKTSLEGIGFDVMVYEDAEQKAMKRTIDNFGEKLKDYPIGLFFYAGHGVQVKGSNYLIPTDARLRSENDTEYDCVNVGRVLAKMESASSKTNIIILDACRDNPFERSWRRSAAGKGLAFMNAPAGSLIAYATAPEKNSIRRSHRKRALHIRIVRTSENTQHSNHADVPESPGRCYRKIRRSANPVGEYISDRRFLFY